MAQLPLGDTDLWWTRAFAWQPDLGKRLRWKHNRRVARAHFRLGRKLVDHQPRCIPHEELSRCFCRIWNSETRPYKFSHTIFWFKKASHALLHTQVSFVRLPVADGNESSPPGSARSIWIIVVNAPLGIHGSDFPWFLDIAFNHEAGDICPIRHVWSLFAHKSQHLLTNLFQTR